MEIFDTNDKGGSAGLHLALARANGDKPYLGDPGVVGHLIRQLLSNVTLRYGEVLAGTMTYAQAPASDQADALALADTFCGRNDAYETVGDWNPAGLARAVREALASHITANAATDDVDAVRLAVGVLVLSLYGLLKQLDDIGAEAVQDAIEATAGDFTNLFVGMPVNGDVYLPEYEGPEPQSIAR